MPKILIKNIYTKVINIVNTYTRSSSTTNICFRKTGIKNTYTKKICAKEVYIKGIFVRASCAKTNYTKNTSIVKYLGMHSQSFQILEIKLFKTRLKIEVGVD